MLLQNHSNIPSAESVHTTEILKLPANIDTFVMSIVSEAHESWKEEQHKLITDKNAYFIPTNIVIYEGTKLIFLDADAPWDTPHPHDLELVNVNNDGNRDASSFSTGILDYTNNSKPFTLPVENYSITDKDYEIKRGTIWSNIKAFRVTDPDSNSAFCTDFTFLELVALTFVFLLRLDESKPFFINLIAVAICFSRSLLSNEVHRVTL